MEPHINLLEPSIDIQSSIRYSSSPLAVAEESIINEAILRYKKFVYLAKKFPKQLLIPTVDVDEVWHEHILHTKNYINDCQQYMGRIMHHNPMRSEIKPDVSYHFQQTSLLWEATFNEPYSNPILAAWCGGGDSDCSSACRGGDDD